jgi:hypothetical protein
MTSTYLAFRLLTQDLPKSLVRTASRTEIAREKAYYEANIGKVRSVDEFLENRRLFAYAMKAYGLEDMVYAKAFMRKVLESDVTDDQSFARKLVDPRYLEFAKAYGFTTDGGVRASLPFVQNDYQIDDLVGLYSEHRVRQGAAAAEEAQYYQARIATLTSVDALLADERLFSYALRAYGIDPTIASASAIRNALTSDLGDPQSAANQLGLRYVVLAAAFNFAPDGSVAAGSAQSAAQLNETVFLHYENTGNGATPAAAAFKSEYYANTIGSIDSVDAFLANDRLFAYALTAYGLNPNVESKAAIREVLISDLTDPSSFANTLTDPRYRTLAAAFNFASDGSISGGGSAQSEAQLDATIEQFFFNYDLPAIRSEAQATAFFRSRINLMTSVDALIANQTLYTYVLKAFDLDPATESKSLIRRVLTSDVSDATSFANSLRDPRYRELAAAFNFGPDGSVLQPRRAQVERAEVATIQLYNSRVGTSASEDAAAREENAYYHNAIIRIRSLDDFLADSRLVAYVLKAYGLEGERVTTDDLRRILSSDPFDKQSFVGRFADTRYRDLAAAFNFTADGKVARVPEQQVQTRSEVLATSDLFVRQTMESDAGNENEGVRLALYFQRKAANITTAFDILADKALLEVVRTALGLPLAMSQADIDVQANNITKRLDIADLRDAKKLDKFLTRFSAMYDMTHGGGFPTLSAVPLFTGGQGAVIGTDMSLLGSLQRIRVGRT